MDVVLGVALALMAALALLWAGLSPMLWRWLAWEYALIVRILIGGIGGALTAFIVLSILIISGITWGKGYKSHGVKASYDESKRFPRPEWSYE